MTYLLLAHHCPQRWEWELKVKVKCLSHTVYNSATCSEMCCMTAIKYKNLKEKKEKYFLNKIENGNTVQ